MFKRMFIVVCVAMMVALSGCSQKKPTEIKTYRELFNYSVSAMKAYKDAPSEYVSLLKDAITILGDDLDENIDKNGEAWTELSDIDELDGAVLIMYFALGSVEDEKFDEKYKDVDTDAFFDTLEKAFIYYAVKYVKSTPEQMAGIMCAAIENNEAELLKLCIKSGANVNAKSDIKDGGKGKKKGITPLIYAIQKERKEMVELLIKSKADINLADDDYDWSPLVWAINSKNKELIEVLVKAKADLNEGFNFAVNRGDMDAINLLIELGADVNGKDKNGVTPIMCTNKESIVKFLIESGADINAKDNNGDTALMKASESTMRGTENFVSFLINCGADVNAKNNEGQTAVTIAKNSRYSGRNLIIAQLKAAGATE